MVGECSGCGCRWRVNFIRPLQRGWIREIFQHACQLGCEGIVSKRLGSRYRSGRSPALRFKNPDAPAVKREAEEDWRR
jgi:hypothetical protein